MLAGCEPACAQNTAGPEKLQAARGPAIRIGADMSDIEQRVCASFGAQRLMQTLGASLALVADGEVHLVLPFSAHLCQQHGFLHAGATAAVLDSACGFAALTKAPPGCEIVSAEFKINLLRPALGERFLAVGKVQSAGKSLTVCTGELRAFSGGAGAYKRVALMQATLANVPAAA